MIFFYPIIFLFLLINCSFDNKSGIWTNNDKKNTKDQVFKDFKKISTKDDEFNKIINIKDLNLNLSEPKTSSQWQDIFYNYGNNSENFKYSKKNQLIFKSKKLSKKNVNKFILLKNNNLILSDKKGNIAIFSIDQNKIVSKFNFYKKKYQKIEKKLNLAVEEKTIFVSDNLGYLYAYDYEIGKILWAKNFKSPFRSNIKILKNKIAASNEKNEFILFNKKNGEIIKKIPTEETIVNNYFINNISSNGNDTLFFLNSFGSLYSINAELLNINWFLNLNSAIELTPNNLFSGVEIVNNKSKIIVSSQNKTYIINLDSGLIERKWNFSSLIRPIINNQYGFFVTKNNLLIAVDMEKNKIIYSYNINKKIADFLDIEKKNLTFLSFRIVEDHIIVFLKNSYVLDFQINGKLDNIYKLPSKIKTEPIYIDSALLFLNKKNQLIILN